MASPPNDLDAELLRRGEEGRMSLDPTENSLHHSPDIQHSQETQNMHNHVADGREDTVNETSPPRVKDHGTHTTQADVRKTNKRDNDHSQVLNKGWQHVVATFKKRDDEMIKDYDEDINTLLVFAGLFSAVLTAFIIDLYKRLEEDTSQSSAQILRRISLQLEGTSGSSLPLLPSVSYIPPPQIIAVNLLWFSSLLLSLFAALFGILAKQWIHVYNKWSEGDRPEDMLFLRYFYLEGFEQYHVSEIIGALPVLLQFALLLFIAGLVTYLWTLHSIIAIFVTSLAGIVVLVALYTIFMPIFQPKCAYKTPLVLFLAALNERKGLLARLRSGLLIIFGYLSLAATISLFIFFLILSKCFNCFEVVTDWLEGPVNFCVELTNQPSPKSGVYLRWKDLDLTRVSKPADGTLGVSSVVARLNVLFDIRYQSDPLQSYQAGLNVKLAKLKVNELDNEMVALLIELIVAHLLHTSPDDLYDTWHISLGAGTLQNLLSFIENTRDNAVGRKIREYIHQWYQDNSIDVRTEIAAHFAKIIKALDMKIDDEEVLFYLTTLRDRTKALGISSDMQSAGPELKLSLNEYSKLWEALHLWVGIAQQRDVDKRLIEDSSELLRILFELHHASQITSVCISNLPSDARHIDLSNDGSQIVLGTSRGAYLYSIATMDNEPHCLEDHFSYIKSVAFSPDGSWIAIGSEDGTIGLWSAITRERIRNLEGHTDAVKVITFSTDGLQIASGSHDHTVRVWDIITGHSMRTLRGHTNIVFAVAFSPDGSQIASGSLDDTVRLWKTSTGAAMHTLRGHRSTVYSVAYSADGSRVVSGSQDGTVRLWDPVSGKSIAILHSHDYDVIYVGFSSDGLHITSRDSVSFARIWNARRYLPSTTVVTALESSKPLLPVFMFDWDTRWMVVKRTDNGQVFPVFRLNNDEELNGRHQSFSGYKVAFALRDGRVRVIDCSSIFTATEETLLISGAEEVGRESA